MSEELRPRLLKAAGLYETLAARYEVVARRALRRQRLINIATIVGVLVVVAGGMALVALWPGGSTLRLLAAAGAAVVATVAGRVGSGLSFRQGIWFERAALLSQRLSQERLVLLEDERGMSEEEALRFLTELTENPAKVWLPPRLSFEGGFEHTVRLTPWLSYGHAFEGFAKGVLEKGVLEDGTSMPPDGVAPPRFGVDRGTTGPTFEADPTDASTAIPPGPLTDDVEFTVSAPRSVQAGDGFLIDLWAHLASQRAEVERRAREAQAEVVDIRTKGTFPIARGTVIHAVLHLDGLEVDQREDWITWQGDIGNASFVARAPEDAAPRAYTGRITLHVEQLRVSTLHFQVRVGERDARTKMRPTDAKWYDSAFASYASADRDEVLGRIQGMQKLRPNMDVFVDVASLRSGELWKKRIAEEVERRDVFYLFWSSAAKASEWVDWEWRHALEQRGIEFIDPVPLVTRDECPPPDELEGYHFNDWMLAYMHRHRERDDSAQ